MKPVVQTSSTWRKLKKILYLSLMVYALIIMTALRTRKPHPKTKLIRSAPLHLPYVVVHFDFKGAPPKLSYLESLLPQLNHAGVNALLMEYEDMFPYQGDLETLRSRNSYNATELMHFLINANRSGFEIIPLVQTFGHLEFALKHDKFTHLRENPLRADSLCPSKHGSPPFITELVKQITDFHNKITPLKHIHIGCDEVYSLNTCEDCKARNVTDVEMFSSHVKAVCDIVTRLSPGTKTLIWDDMIRDIHPQLLNELNLPIEPVAWHYGNERLIPHKDAYKYHRSFGTIWLASAYKGADDIFSIIPNLRNRFHNHYIWMQFIRSYSILFPSDTRSNFRGIILTGWSRYSHFSTIYDLLQVSIPSLFANLHLIKMLKSENFIDLTLPGNTVFTNYVWPKLRETLECKNTVIYSVREFNASYCKFEGAGLYKIIQKLSYFHNKIDDFLDKMESQILIERTVEESVRTKAYKETNAYLRVLLKATRKIKRVMAPYYVPAIAEEYVSNMNQDRIRRLMNVLNMIKYTVENDHDLAIFMQNQSSIIPNSRLDKENIFSEIIKRV